MRNVATASLIASIGVFGMLGLTWSTPLAWVGVALFAFGLAGNLVWGR